MKHIYQHTKDKLTLAVFISLVTLSGGCSDEEFHCDSFSGEEIAFQAELSDEWISTTRSCAKADENGGAAAFQLKTATGSDSLYIHQTVEDRFVTLEENGDSVCTRGNTIDATSFSNLSVGIFASVFKGEWDESENEMNYMHNVRYSNKGSGKLTSDEENYFWPAEEEKNVRLFAYAPYNDENITFTSGNTGSPKFRFRVPDDVADQREVLVAQTASKDTETLTFSHALTAVKFKTGDDLLPGAIVSVRIKNIYMEGEYSFADNCWSVPADVEKQDFYYECDKTVGNSNSTPDYVKVDEGKNIFGDDDGLTLLMIPQKIKASTEGNAGEASSNGDGEESSGDADETVSKNPQIEIEYRDNIWGVTNTYSIDLDINWEAGKTVTYKISSSSISVEYTFSVDASKSVFYPIGYDSGAEKATYVKSYCTITNAKTGESISKPIPFKISYVGGKPSWVTYPSQGIKNPSESNPTADVIISVNVATRNTEARPNTCLEWDELMKKSMVYDYDLSTAGGTMKRNTANCYIVNAPGTYKIPLVYGNAIKNNEEYPDAYRSNRSNEELSNFLGEFRRHDDLPINATWIKDNTKTDEYGNTIYLEPASASLIWQASLEDAQIVVVNNNLSEDKRFLEFEVPKDNIRPGHAVVAVKDIDGNIMWSWHIWITTYELDVINGKGYVTSEDKNGTRYSFMTVDLGHLEVTTKKFDTRSFKIRYLQSTTNKSVDITYYQNGDNWNYGEAFTTYQRGRKDPVSYSYLRTYKNADGISQTSPSSMMFQDETLNLQDLKKVLGSVTIGASIKNPIHLYYNSWGFCTDYETGKSCCYSNLWNINVSTDTESKTIDRVKTVYDPCPAGFMVPPNEVPFSDYLSVDGKVLTESGNYIKYMCNGVELKFPKVYSAYAIGNSYSYTDDDKSPRWTGRMYSTDRGYVFCPDNSTKFVSSYPGYARAIRGVSEIEMPEAASSGGSDAGGE